MKPPLRIVLTGGPCGGKSQLIKELQRDPDWSSQIATLPEAIYIVRQAGFSPEEQIFQRVMVYLQRAVEDALTDALSDSGIRAILCHRGSLDPLAYWLDRGWSQKDFFSFTRTKIEDHYCRYTAVIHLVTAADGAASFYTRWPEADRHENMEDAIRLDRFLQQAWSGHPAYYRLDNQNCDWSAKSQAARTILNILLNASI